MSNPCAALQWAISRHVAACLAHRFELRHARMLATLKLRGAR